MANREEYSGADATEVNASQPAVLQETDHSVIEKTQWRGVTAVVKRFRDPDNPRTLARFHREVDALKAVKGEHENLTHLLAHAAQPGALTLTLRLEAGHSLDQFVVAPAGGGGDDGSSSNGGGEARPGGAAAATTTLSRADAAAAWAQVAGALAHLHALPLVHDDVKPSNVMWCGRRRRAVLIDFGAAVFPATTTPPDGDGDGGGAGGGGDGSAVLFPFNPSGTPSYAPPEFLARRKGPAGDVWGLGVTMLFALGHVPLPDGEWLLPAVFDEEVGGAGAGVGDDCSPRAEMLRWLDEVERLRVSLAADNPLLVAMLERDPEVRISSAELSRRLGSL